MFFKKKKNGCFGLYGTVTHLVVWHVLEMYVSWRTLYSLKCLMPLKFYNQKALKKSKGESILKKFLT